MAEVGPAVGDLAADRMARALRDRGFEVIRTGPGQTVEQVASTVLQEDADAVGLVVGDGDVGSTPGLHGELSGRGLADVVVFGGGAGPGSGADPAATASWLASALDARDSASVE